MVIIAEAVEIRITVDVIIIDAGFEPFGYGSGKPYAAAENIVKPSFEIALSIKRRREIIVVDVKERGVTKYLEKMPIVIQSHPDAGAAIADIAKINIFLKRPLSIRSNIRIIAQTVK